MVSDTFIELWKSTKMAEYMSLVDSKTIREKFGLTSRQLKRGRDEHGLPHYRYGRQQYWYDEEKVADWIEKRKTAKRGTISRVETVIWYYEGDKRDGHLVLRKGERTRELELTKGELEELLHHSIGKGGELYVSEHLINKLKNTYYNF